jgi:6-phosphogluconolactonase
MSQFRFVFVGTYTEPILFGTGQVLQGKGKGIHVYRFDTLSGALEPYGLAEGVRNPSYLAFHPSRRYLYAVNEYKQFEGRASGAVSAFALDPDRGQLTFINQKATSGTDPCHLTVTRSGDCMLAANFASGSFCVLPLRPDGSLGDDGDFVQHQGSSIDPKRQAGPHAHGVTLDLQERFAFIPDLGLDRVMIYELDAARARVKPNRTPWWTARPGAGPRQLVMHPGGRFAYLINELNSTMTAFCYDAEQGALEEMQTLSTLPEGFEGHSTCAEVQITPEGNLLYGSNRGHNSLVIYAIDPAQGTLRLVGHASTRGSIPRNFTVDPSGSWVIVANQDSDNLAVFRIDHASGALVPVGEPVVAPTPVCVKVL